MKHYMLDEMVRGWFVGNFSPNAYQTSDVEVAVKQYKKGDQEAAHYHKIATEITLIVSGRVKLLGCEWGAGDIIVIEPGECTAFCALLDTVTVVVKIPGANDDKYLTGEEKDD